MAQSIVLFELDQHLTYLDAVARFHPDVLDRAGERCGHIGFHLHGFDDQQQVVGLNLLSDLRVAAHNRLAGHWAAANLRLIGDLFAIGSARAWGRQPEQRARTFSARSLWRHIRRIHARLSIVLRDLNFNIILPAINRDL